jgi:serine/threonine protein kinase
MLDEVSAGVPVPFLVALTWLVFARKLILFFGHITPEDVDNGCVTPAEIHNEVRAIRKFSGSSLQNVVKSIRHGVLKPHVYHIDMEFCEFSLHDYIRDPRSNPIRTKRTYSRLRFFKGEIPLKIHIVMDILEGLVHIHALGEIHRDLKPQNSTATLVCH